MIVFFFSLLPMAGFCLTLWYAAQALYGKYSGRLKAGGILSVIVTAHKPQVNVSWPAAKCHRRYISRVKFVIIAIGDAGVGLCLRF